MDSVRKLNQAINKAIHKSGLDRRVLQNKYVLYTIVVISVLNVFGMIMGGDLTTPLLFVLVGLLTSFFCKNMLVILGLALLVANIAKYGLGVGGLGSDAGPEGFDTATADAASEPHEIVDTEQYLEKDEDKGTDKTKGQGQGQGTDKNKDKNKGAKEAQKKMQATNQKMEAMQNQYKKLEGLQNQILEGMKQVTDGLDQADKVLENLKKNAKGVANAPP